MSKLFLYLFFALSLIITTNSSANDETLNPGLYNYEFRTIYQSALNQLEKIAQKDTDKFILALAYLQVPEIDSCFFDPTNIEEMGQIVDTHPFGS